MTTVTRWGAWSANLTTLVLRHDDGRTIDLSKIKHPSDAMRVLSGAVRRKEYVDDDLGALTRAMASLEPLQARVRLQERRGAFEARIIAAITGGGCGSRNQIARAAGMDRSTCFRAVDALLNSGRIRQTTDGVFEVVAPSASRDNHSSLEP